MAHALTAARVLLALPFAWLMARGDAGHAALAALVFIAAVMTDLLDGLVARRRAAATPAGGAFDHAADYFFVTCGLVGGVIRSVFPWILPVLVTAAFTQYVVDSYWLHRDRVLRTSRLGRWNGILYFAPLGGDVLVQAGLHALRPAVAALAWILVVTTLVSMAERLRAVMARSPTARGSPAGRTEDRPPR